MLPDGSAAPSDECVTSPYDYPVKYFGKDSEKNNRGTLIYETKNELTQVSTDSITFRLDEAFENESENQILKDKMVFALGTDMNNPADDVIKTDINAADKMTYNFYSECRGEIVPKGEVTKNLVFYSYGGKSLTKENSKTTIQVIYPSDVELVSLEETALYKKDGNIVKTEKEGDNIIATVEWDEPGSFSEGITVKPHIRIPKDSARPDGSSFYIKFKNFSKTIYEADPGRTSVNNVASLKVVINKLDSGNSFKIVGLNDYGTNWSKDVSDSYNIRLGSVLIANRMSEPTVPKTITMNIDKNGTAIIRGITIPYANDEEKGIKTDYTNEQNKEKYKIRWTSASGKSGENILDDVITRSSGKGNEVSALIKNTSLGLDKNDSIKTVSVDIGPIPGNYDGAKPFYDQWGNGFIQIKAPCFWSFSSIGVFGTWKKGTDRDIESDITISDTDDNILKMSASSNDTESLMTVNDIHDSATCTVKGVSSPPRVINGVGDLDKTQINGGDFFTVTGRLNDFNWDTNPLQEPVLYVIMPEGFTYSDLKIYDYYTKDEIKLNGPEYKGHFTGRNNIGLDVWQYEIDINDKDSIKTAGHYQPDFTDFTIAASVKIRAGNTAAKNEYHINDFIAFTTKNFSKIGAEISAEKWDYFNWSTSQYTNKDLKDPNKSYDVFEGKINDGNPMVSLSSKKGVIVNQPAEVVAKATFTANGKKYDYKKGDESTIAKLKPGEEVNLHIAVANNETGPVNHVDLYVPLLKEGTDFGPSFMPEGKITLPLDLKAVKCSSNFRTEYLKVKNSATDKLNEIPSSYETVVKEEANMIRFTADKPISVGDGGSIDITFKMPEDISTAYNNKTDVITPVLYYNIANNKATLTKKPAAVKAVIESPETINIAVKKVWNGIEAKDAPEVKVNLLRNGEKTSQYIILNNKNNWEDAFKNIQVSERANSEKYVFTVEEEKLEKYKSSVTGNQYNGFVITNTLEKDNDHSKDKDKHDRDNSGGGSSDTSIININKPSAGNLNITDHYAYLFGYKDWTFRPDGNMTRAEVTAMFGRLMKVYPDKNAKYSIPYSDVKDNAWYSLAVGYLNDKGLIKGYPDGTFRPDSKITRAEFAAIASRFENITAGNSTFKDVPATHWAKKYIDSAAEKGWIKGYPDGTFRPNKNITRAEVTAVTNHMLNREADRAFADSHLKEMAVYSDIKNHWAYYDILEASNGHDYHRVMDNKEIWENLNHKAFLFCVEDRNEYFINAGGAF